MSQPAKAGLNVLLRPEDSVLVLIDHQPFQLASLNSHDPHMVVNNVTSLAKAARIFTEVIQQHAAGSGIAFMWEQQPLSTAVPGVAV